MRFKKIFLSLFLSITLLFTGCGKITLPTNANATFENFTLGLFKEDISTTTLGLHYTLEHPAAYGVTDIPITLGSFETNAMILW